MFCLKVLSSRVLTAAVFKQVALPHRQQPAICCSTNLLCWLLSVVTNGWQLLLVRSLLFLLWWLLLIMLLYYVTLCIRRLFCFSDVVIGQYACIHRATLGFNLRICNVYAGHFLFCVHNVTKLALCITGARQLPTRVRCVRNIHALCTAYTCV